MYITGYKKEAAKLLDKFVWGHSFIELNRELLEAYSEAPDAKSVLAVQEQYITDAEADVDTRKHATRLTIDQLMEMGNPNHPEYQEAEDEEEEDEEEDEDEKETKRDEQKA